MTEYSHPILVRGRYQIVALTHEQQYDPAEVSGYAVLSPTGERLHYELGLEPACSWVDRLTQEALINSPAAIGPAKQRR